MRVRGEYGFSSLLKQNKKTKICFVIYIAGFFFLNFLCYEVFAKQKIYKLSSNYYYQVSPTRRDIDVDFDGRGSTLATTTGKIVVYVLVCSIASIVSRACF